MERHTPFLLNDSQSVWLVQEGKLELYAVRVKNGEPYGRRRYLFSAECGQALLGMDIGAEAELAILAVGSLGTTLVKRSQVDLLAQARIRQNKLFAEPVLFMVESWVLGLVSGISRKALPNRFVTIGAGESIAVQAGAVIRPVSDIVWIRIKTGRIAFGGQSELAYTEQAGWLPLTEDSWLVAQENSELEAILTEGLLDFAADPEAQGLWQAVQDFQHLAVAAIGLNIQQENERERVRLTQRLENDAVLVQRSFARLLSFAGQSLQGIEREGALVAACKMVCRHQGIDSSQIKGVVEKNEISFAAVRRLAQASHLRMRKVLLRAEWYQQDNGPLLAFWVQKDTPVALLPQGSGGYVVWDPATGSRSVVTAELAEQLSPQAVMFYRSLPLPSAGMSVLRFAAASCKRQDIWTIVLTGLAGALLMMIPPVASGIIFQDIIPSVDRQQHGMLSALLVIGAMAGLTFQIVRSIALVRIEARVDSDLQAALWDRLLDLPVTFFRQFTVGDLALRANGINGIRQLLSTASVMVILTSMFSLGNVLLLFYYNVQIAAVMCALLLLLLLCSFVLGSRQFSYKKQLMHYEGKISGVVLQVINGIAKFKIAGAENRAYYLWARDFGQQRLVASQSRKLLAGQTVLNTAYPACMSMVLYYMVYTRAHENSLMTIADFLAFNSAMVAVSSAMVALSTSWMAIAQAIPLFKRLQPILLAEPEVDEAKADAGELTGDIEVSHVSFRYRSEGELILNNVSLKVNRGEFVAVVGMSGSGKSTLLRLLLGFEKPEAGAVFYDRQELGGLNIRSVRSQLGVVLQNGQLMTGDIFHNIIGSLDLTLEDAWQAAKMAGIDEDIRRMPMGMHTFISEGASTISGGQRQRLLIARAIVNRPRIIFFDEATSALDNRTQAIVSESLERLKATRVVIAHRLSTIVNADRILVMDKGAIVESGTYTELMDKGGLFSELAKRQIA